MSRTYNDIDKEKYDELESIAYKMSKELFKDGFSKDSIYTFLHTVVGVGLYKAEIDNILCD